MKDKKNEFEIISRHVIIALTKQLKGVVIRVIGGKRQLSGARVNFRRRVRCHSKMRNRNRESTTTPQIMIAIGVVLPCAIDRIATAYPPMAEGNGYYVKSLINQDLFPAILKAVCRMAFMLPAFPK